MLLKPVSIRRVRCDNMEWTVEQDFTRHGKPVRVVSYGYSRFDALDRFADEIYWAERTRDFDLLEAWGESLWQMAGVIDVIMKLMTRSQNNMKGKYTHEQKFNNRSTRR